MSVIWGGGDDGRPKELKHYVSKEEWIDLFGRAEITLKNLDVVPCRCDDPACKGWQAVFPGQQPTLPTSKAVPPIPAFYPANMARLEILRQITVERERMSQLIREGHFSTLDWLARISDMGRPIMRSEDDQERRSHFIHIAAVAVAAVEAIDKRSRQQPDAAQPQPQQPMTFAQYQEQAVTTAIYPESAAIFYPALGLASEAGEVAGKVKKVYRDNDGQFASERVKAIGDEIGGCLWYLAALARDLGLSLDEIASDNLAILASRKSRGVLSGSGDNR